MADALRTHLARALAWHEAHVAFDDVLDRFPAELRGRVPAGLPYSGWQLLEHARLAQHDILEFCRNPEYREMNWPDDYWPKSAEPPPSSWDDSVADFRRDRDSLVAIAVDPAVDLSARIPHGSGQTYARELLLVVDHNAYHLGEMVAVLRLLGAWRRP